MEYRFNDERKTYEIEKFEQTIVEVKEFIKNNAHLDLVIANDLDKKVVKEDRAVINAKLKEVKTLRLELNKAVMGEVNMQLKEVESLLNDASDQLTKKINEYDKKMPTFQLIVKSTDKEYLEKLLNEINEEKKATASFKGGE